MYLFHYYLINYCLPLREFQLLNCLYGHDNYSKIVLYGAFVKILSYPQVKIMYNYTKYIVKNIRTFLVNTPK